MGGGLPRGVNAPGDRPEGLSPGYAFSDRLASESVIGFVRNERSACPGIGDRHGPEHATLSRHSRRMVPITRSTNGFCQGLHGAVKTFSIHVSND